MSYFSDLINNRETAKREAAEAEEAEERRATSEKNFNTALNQFVDQYRQWAKDNKSDKFKDSSDDDIKNRMVDLINRSGVADKKFDKGDNNSVDYYDYGTNFIDGMYSTKGGVFSGVKNRMEAVKSLSDEDKSALYELVKLEDNIKKYNAGEIQNKFTGIDQDKAKRGLLVRKQIDDFDISRNKKNNMGNFMDVFENYEKYQSKDESTEEGASKTSENKSGNASKDSDTVEFTLTKANDPNYKGFGQKLVDLGLATENGLWGENGDVAYYTKQLNDQGIYGNLPIGKTIRLKRRK